MGCREAELELVAVGELIADVVAVGIAAVGCAVTFALVEGDLDSGLEGVVAVGE